MRANPLIIQFILEQAESQPLGKRVTLYRAVADIMPTNDQRNELLQLAERLEASEDASRQILFQFTQANC